MSSSLSRFALTVLFVASCSIVTAQEWGSLKGKFVFEGDVPAIGKPDPGTDKVCIAAAPEQQKLKLGDGKELANVVIYLRPGRGDELAVHPDCEKLASEPVVLDNKTCVFVPHITLVNTGQTLLIKNSDPTGHNTKGALASNGEFNYTLAANGQQELTFDEEERLPMPVSCSIHPFMTGYLVVRENPYMTVSAADGTFEIKNIPAGEHEFQFWHELSGYLKDVNTTSGELDRTGRIEIEIPANGVVDLGTIEVPADIFE